ncbi:MAG: transcriptional regulator NrdR [Planctomycetaceae bacterium]|jgi:transcriptional repressor NrdR|nr:transcriptional regulator NrdR [Planctomycetaceae bacterium]
MKCPICHQDNDRVVDTRMSDDGSVIRRRRECCNCGRRFTTFERLEVTSTQVVKKDGHRVPFDREKLRCGLERACWKRPVSEEQITTIIAQVEIDVNSSFNSEVDSRFIGERVMEYLREIDQVAYVRFASVYLCFEEARDFAKELDNMMDSPKKREDYPPPKKRKK